MIYYYFLLSLTGLLSIGVVVLAVLAYRNQADQSKNYYLLATLAIFLMACIVPFPLTIGYKAAIIFGILLALIGSVLYRLARAPVSVAEAFELIVILLYSATFATLHPTKWPTPWLLILLILALFFYLALHAKLAELKGTVALYTTALLLVLWQATEVLVVEQRFWSWLAFAGVFALVVVKLLHVVHHAYSLGYREETSERAVRSYAEGWKKQAPVWLQPVVPGAVMQRRLTRWVLQSRQLATNLLDRSRLPQLANRTVPLLPLFALLYQWLLVVSIWGLELNRLLKIDL